MSVICIHTCIVLYMYAYHKLLFCTFLLKYRECPLELKEAVASIIFAAPRCSNLPDYYLLGTYLVKKYGKELILAASKVHPDTSVNSIVSYNLFFIN
ncbi:putative vacuolar protein sorting-associated protein Ist1 [Helianthus anomalus]